MRRKTFPQALLGAVLVTALVVTLVSTISWGEGSSGDRVSETDDAEQAEGSQPNVLIILTDDQRPGLRHMPKTKKWFKEGGVHYPRAVVTTPTCCPSRASIMSGTYAHNHRVLDTNGQGYKLNQDWTLQRHLSDAGYRTGMFGKYFVGWDENVDPEHFDEWAVMHGGDSKSNYYGGVWNVQGRLKRIKRYSTGYLQRKGVQFIRRYSPNPEPWFLYLSTWAPHQPAIPPPRYEDAPVPKFKPNPATWEKDRSDKPPWVQELGVKRKKNRAFSARQRRTLMAVDDMVDELLRELRAQGQLDNTIAFFVSDNGFSWGENGVYGKRAPYLPSISVPMYSRNVGDLPPGSKDRRLVANIDVAPTIYEALGIEPQHTLDGRPLQSDHSRDRVLLEMWSRGLRTNSDWAALLGRRYQYVETFDSDRMVPEFREYYDLVNDPWQLQNLLVGQPPPGVDTAALSLQLSKDMVCQGTTGPSACP